jgi:carbon storage regulator CsrA
MTDDQHQGHLALTRRSGESILIGEHIVVKVVKVNYRQAPDGSTMPEVRLLITAPRQLTILREELVPTEVRTDADDIPPAA